MVTKNSTHGLINKVSASLTTCTTCTQHVRIAFTMSDATFSNSSVSASTPVPMPRFVQSFWFRRKKDALRAAGDATPIDTITFAIGRYGKVCVTLHFRVPVSLAAAVRRAELFLSKPLTPEYFDRVASANDLFPGTECNSSACRGKMLGDCVFVEEIHVRGRSVTLECGS